MNMKILRVFCFLFAMLPFFGVSAQQLKVMTYNIRFDNPADGVNQWGNRKEMLFALVRKYSPDIIGVQEALHHQLEAIKIDQSRYDYVGVGRDDGKLKGEFSPVFYDRNKFDLVDHNTFWLSLTPTVPGSKGWDAQITRVATWVILKDKETRKKFFVLNTHFDHMGKQARIESAVLIKSQIEKLSRGLPVIVTGDFNCTRDEKPYAVMTEPSGISLADPAPPNPPGTFCNFEVNSMECRGIDYIFHSAKWSSVDYQVITDHDGKNYPSDHLPVMVTLSLK